jgi:hypothetical protein
MIRSGGSCAVTFVAAKSEMEEFTSADDWMEGFVSVNGWMEAVRSGGSRIRRLLDAVESGDGWKWSDQETVGYGGIRFVSK